MILTAKSAYERAVITKAAQASYFRSSDDSGPAYFDAYQQRRSPSFEQLVGAFKNTVYACVTLRAYLMKYYSPDMYVRVAPGDPTPKAATRELTKFERYRIRTRRDTQPDFDAALGRRGIEKSDPVEKVLEHGALTTLRTASRTSDRGESFTLHQIFQDLTGWAYWATNMSPFGPTKFWVLPTQDVDPQWRHLSQGFMDFDDLWEPDYYRVRVGAQSKSQTLDVYPALTPNQPFQMVPFRSPNPHEPYSGSWSPTRAAWELITLESELWAYMLSMSKNKGMPSIFVSPPPSGEIQTWNQDETDVRQKNYDRRFQRGGAGRAWFSGDPLNVQALGMSAVDMSAAAMVAALKEAIANEFGIPIAILTSNTNMANFGAGFESIMTTTVRPLLHMRDERLTSKFLRMFDPMILADPIGMRDAEPYQGRVFFLAEDPVPHDINAEMMQMEKGVAMLAISPDEVRREIFDLPPAPWIGGKAPFIEQWKLSLDEETAKYQQKYATGGKNPNDRQKGNSGTSKSPGSVGSVKTKAAIASELMNALNMDAPGEEIMAAVENYKRFSENGVHA